MMDDYIPRDAVLQKMWNALYALEDQQEAASGLDILRRADVQAGFEAGQQVVAEFPAADVRPVKRGFWWTYPDEDPDSIGNLLVWCSECDTEDHHVPGKKVPFCWHCGAEMSDEVKRLWEPPKQKEEGQMVRVYGYCDDLVEIEGSGYKESEIDCFEKDVRICFRDGTVIRVGYSKPDMAVWYVIIEKVGTAAQTLTECMDEDADVYSDVFEIESEVLTHEVVRKEAAQ